MTGRRWILALAAVAVVVVGVGVALSNRNKARPVSVEEAEERIGSTSSVVSGTRGRPEPGVYRYEGSGTDELSLPPLSQPQGPTMPGSVELLDDGCWRFRIDFSTNHWQSWTFCRRGQDLVETTGQSWQRWMIGPQGFDNLSTFTCEPPAAILPAAREPEQEWEERCTGGNEGAGTGGETVSAGPLTFIGHVDLEVGGATVRAAHVRRQRRYSGAQEGTERVDWWLDVETGLPLRNRRTISARTDTVVGETTYTEVGEFHLLSRDPAG